MRGIGLKGDNLHLSGVGPDGVALSETTIIAQSLGEASRVHLLAVPMRVASHGVR